MERILKCVISVDGTVLVTKQNGFENENNAIKIVGSAVGFETYEKYIDFNNNGTIVKSPNLSDGTKDFEYYIPQNLSTGILKYQFVFIDDETIIKSHVVSIEFKESINATELLEPESTDIFHDFEVRISEVEDLVNNFIQENETSIEIGTVESGASPSVVNVGTAKDQVWNFVLKSGISPNLQIGSVETLDENEQCTATITGTQENPILNLGITRGYSAINRPLIHQFVNERYARTANRTINFTGTNYYVDSSRPDNSGNGLSWATAKKTITAAYDIVPSGSIINLAAGTYLTSSEPNGYILFNRPGIRVLIRSDYNQIIECNAANSYVLRMRDCGEVVLQNITVKSNQDNPLIILDGDYNDRIFVAYNCVLETSSNGSQSCILNKGLTPSARITTRHIEFKNCTINRTNSTKSLLKEVYQTADDVFIIDNCVINNSGYTAIELGSTNVMNLCLYDNKFYQGSNHPILSLGEDTTVPTSNNYNYDLRNNELRYNSGYYGHGLLLGRGTVKGYVANNKIFQNEINNSLNIGLVVKSTPVNLGDLIIEGNYVYSPRPLYIKGGSKNMIKYNTFICNENNWESFGLVNWKNGADEVLSQNNDIQYNNLVSIKFGIKLYSIVGETQEITDTAKTCVINNNKYYCPDDYLYNEDTSTAYSFINKSNFWGVNTNDNNSIELSLLNLPITY